MKLIEPNGGFALYFASAACLALAVRIASVSIRAAESGTSSFRNEFWIAFRGYGASDPKMDDYWQTFILGFLESIAYSLMFAVDKPEGVAAWLALKTVPQWGHWKESRNIYNRFLIGNGLVVIGSYVLAIFSFQMSNPLCWENMLCVPLSYEQTTVTSH